MANPQFQDQAQNQNLAGFPAGAKPRVNLAPPNLTGSTQMPPDWRRGPGLPPPQPGMPGMGGVGGVQPGAWGKIPKGSPGDPNRTGGQSPFFNQLFPQPGGQRPPGMGGIAQLPPGGGQFGSPNQQQQYQDALRNLFGGAMPQFGGAGPQGRPPMGPPGGGTQPGWFGGGKPDSGMVGRPQVLPGQPMPPGYYDALQGGGGNAGWGGEVMTRGPQAGPSREAPGMPQGPPRDPRMSGVTQDMPGGSQTNYMPGNNGPRTPGTGIPGGGK